MALILPPGTKIRGAVLGDGYARLSSVTISGRAATSIIYIYADKAERIAGNRPLDIITIASDLQELISSNSGWSSVVGAFYELIKLDPMLTGSVDDL